MTTIKSECLVCKSTFLMTDTDERVIAAYRLWDADHKHPERKS